MNEHAISGLERGAVLVVAMLFLLVVTIISVVAARNSNLSTEMASNMQDAYSSFQSAEAGILATLLLAKTDNDPFIRADVDKPFEGFTPETHPLRDLNDDGAEDMRVETYYNPDTISCPRQEQRHSTTDILFDCEYYRVESEHDAPQRARTRVDMGVVKTIMKSG